VHFDSMWKEDVVEKCTKPSFFHQFIDLRHILHLYANAFDPSLHAYVVSLHWDVSFDPKSLLQRLLP
jgi:hypothetical protein